MRCRVRPRLRLGDVVEHHLVDAAPGQPLMRGTIVAEYVHNYQQYVPTTHATPRPRRPGRARGYRVAYGDDAEDATPLASWAVSRVS